MYILSIRSCPSFRLVGSEQGTPYFIHDIMSFAWVPLGFHDMSDKKYAEVVYRALCMGSRQNSMIQDIKR
jgi:hypothetical protein